MHGTYGTIRCAEAIQLDSANTLVAVVRETVRFFISRQLVQATLQMS